MSEKPVHMNLDRPHAHATHFPLKWTARHSARNTVELIGSVYVWIMAAVFTLLMGMWAIPVMMIGVPKIAHNIARLWGRGLMRLSGVRLRVLNPEKIYEAGPVIYLSNHLSVVDIPIFYEFLRTQFRWISKASLFKIPIIGTAMKRAGYISVDRTDRRKAMESLFEAAKRIQEGSSVIVFPEGTVGPHDGSMLSFKKGSFVLAKKSRVVLQPVTLWGTQNVMPDKQQRLIHRFYRSNVDVTVHDPIFPEEYENLSPDEISQKIWVILDKSLEKYRGVQQTQAS